MVSFDTELLLDPVARPLQHLSSLQCQLHHLPENLYFGGFLKINRKRRLRVLNDLRAKSCRHKPGQREKGKLDKGSLSPLQGMREDLECKTFLGRGGTFRSSKATLSFKAYLLGLGFLFARRANATSKATQKAN